VVDLHDGPPGHPDASLAKTDQPNQAQRVSGQFAGVATTFTVWENAIPALYPSAVGGATFFHVTLSPPATSAETTREIGLLPGEKGRLSPALGHVGFDVPVTGDLVGRRLTLRLQNARRDFEVKARALYIIVTPQTLLNPFVGFALPYKDAHFVLRAMGDGVADFDVTIDGKRMSIARELTNVKEASGIAGNTGIGRYSLRVKACNPACP
jgi:hypothetical protein